MNLKTIAVNMAIFLLILNSVTFAVEASGVAADWGVQPTVGGDERIEGAKQNASAFNTTGGAGETLFSLFTTGARRMSPVFDFIFAGPNMFENLGFPTWATTVMFAPLYFVWVGLILYVATGRLL